MHCFFAILLMQLRYYSAFLSVILKVVKYLLGPVLVGIVLETLFHRNLAPCNVYFCWAELVLHISNWVLKKRETFFCVSHMFSLAIRRDLKRESRLKLFPEWNDFTSKSCTTHFKKIYLTCDGRERFLRNSSQQYSESWRPKFKQNMCI